jgi:prophage regulatory protein
MESTGGDTTLTAESIIREREERKLTQLSRMTRSRLERKGQYPRRRRLGPHSVGRMRSEVMAWLANRPKA